MKQNPRTILQWLIFAKHGVASNMAMNRVKARRSLDMAVDLLSKGYTLDDFVEPLIEKYGKNPKDIPDTRTNAGMDIDGLKMRELFETLIPKIPHGFGVCLVTFPFNKINRANYVSNARREDMIKELRNLADSLEKGRDFETPINN